MTRQSYCKGRPARLRAEAGAELAERLARGERPLQPRLGGRKSLKILVPLLENEGIKLGRGRLFSILREKGLLVPPLPKGPRTARLEPSLPAFHSLAAGLELAGPNQAWAADITHVRADEGLLNLSLIADMWPRKTAGFHAGDSLEAEGALAALAMALASPRSGAKPARHSGRGCQYASHLYVGKLREAGLEISMAEGLHCYENAMAERAQMGY